jgi:flagellar basal-body rod protein FlgC
MGLDGIFSGTQVSVSGLRAERLRMEVVAQNIANAEVTRAGPSGEPYRRQVVLFAQALGQARGKLPDGVRVQGVVQEKTPFQLVYRPGHPDADEKGYLALPNVNLPFEMVDLATSARAYEANLAAIRAWKEISEHALSIGGRS